MENAIQRILGIINLLNEIEVKGFYNIKNLGLAIQQLDNLAGEMNQQIKKVQQNKQAEN